MVRAGTACCVRLARVPISGTCRAAQRHRRGIAPSQAARRAGARRDNRIDPARGRALLTELQLLADRDMSSLEPGTPSHQLVAARAKEGLADRGGRSRGTHGPRLGPLHQAMAIEGLRTDLEWLSTLVARLDGETPHPVTAWLDVELQRLRAWLGTAPGPDPDPRDESLRAGCGECRRSSETAHRARAGAVVASAGAPTGLWAERFHLSRLQTQVETLEPGPLARGPHGEACPRELPDGSTPSPTVARGRLSRVARPPGAMPRELAAEAFLDLNALELPGRAEACQTSSRRPSTR